MTWLDFTTITLALELRNVCTSILHINCPSISGHTSGSSKQANQLTFSFVFHCNSRGSRHTKRDKSKRSGNRQKKKYHTQLTATDNTQPACLHPSRTATPVFGDTPTLIRSNLVSTTGLRFQKYLRMTTAVVNDDTIDAVRDNGMVYSTPRVLVLLRCTCYFVFFHRDASGGFFFHVATGK